MTAQRLSGYIGKKCQRIARARFDAQRLGARCKSEHQQGIGFVPGDQFRKFAIDGFVACLENVRDDRYAGECGPPYA
jgi:hypothetical protein